MADWGGAASGALGGAASGATIGSLVPGIGTPIGAGVGGIFGGIAGLFGKKKKKKRSTMDRSQKNINDQQYESIFGRGPLSDLYNYDPEKANAVFDKNIANPAYRNLNEKGIPSLTGQFRNQGLMNSSYAGDAVGRLARDTQERLDAQRAQYLYDQENNARSAKRSAVEDFQNRTNFDYDTSARGGFNLDHILKSVDPKILDQLKDYFAKSGTQTTTPTT
jgi:hypothetical protein